MSLALVRARDGKRMRVTVQRTGGKFGVDVYTLADTPHIRILPLRPPRHREEHLDPRGDRIVAIEARSAREYRSEFSKGLDALGAAVSARYIVYRGSRELSAAGIRVLPVDTFLRRLHQGDIIG